MKILVCGSIRRTGTSRATSQPFDFSTVHCLTTMEHVNNDNFQTLGVNGYEMAEISATPECIKALQNIDLPCELEFTVDNQLRKGKLEPILTGLKA